MTVPNATEKWSPARRRRVYLMRHAEVDYFDERGTPHRPGTVPLNAEGRAQAEAAAKALAGVALDRAITSGLRRSVETAEVVLAGRAVPVEPDPRLREIEVGRMSEWAGSSSEEVERLFLGMLSGGLDEGSRFLAGETFGSCRERVAGCWAEVVARRDWRGLLVVAHGVVNRLLLAGLLGAGLGALGSLEQDAGCVNLVEVDDSGACLVRLVNYTPVSPLKDGMECSTVEGLYRQYLRGRVPPSPPAPLPQGERGE